MKDGMTLCMIEMVSRECCEWEQGIHESGVRSPGWQAHE